MSLKNRLRISIVTLVTLFVFAECVLSLLIAAEAKFKDAIDGAQAITEQVQHLVRLRLNEQAAAAKPGTVRGRDFWRGLVENDKSLPPLLQKTLTGALAVVEILVCDSDGIVLASSNLDQEKKPFQPLPGFVEWTQRPLWDRLLEVLTQSQDYVRVAPLGIPGDPQPIVSIRVVTSTVLVKGAIMPQVRTTLLVSALSMLVSVALAYLFSNVILRSLDRLSQRIESMATGHFTEPGSPKPDREAKEFADMQSKLDLLSQRFRGARDDVEQLRANVDRMMERLEEAVLLFDSRQRLQRASRSAEHLLAMPREEMASRGMDGLFPADSPLGATIRRAMLSGMNVRDIAVTLDRDGPPPVRVLANVELLDGNVLITLRDAETRRQLRSQLDISTRLAAISRLTGGVAHEIKNPLNAMALHLEILRSKLERDEEVGNEVNVIGGEIARLDRVVKTFLDFTRPVDLKWEDVDLSEVAAEVAGLVGPEAKRAAVEIDLASPGPARIRGDRDLLKQAVLNVVNNGIEAMKSGGKLEIAVSRDAGDAVLQVTDQGDGIPDAVRDKIFNLYFTTKQKGSGIGLAMTFRIVQLHNASIDFQTVPGEGTTFRMRFAELESSDREAIIPAIASGSSAG